MKSFFLLFMTFWLTHSYAAPHPYEKSQKYFFTYQVHLKPYTKEGKSLSLWVPYPQENQFQKVLKFKSHSPWPIKLTSEWKYGNQMIYIQGKTSLKPVTLTFEYEIERFTKSIYKQHDKFLKPSLYLGPDKLIPIFPQIKKLASEESKSTQEPFQKIRAFYDYVIRTMTYDKSEGSGRGDAVWACTYKRGNCTDFHSLFIALNRCETIPARFEMGVSIPEDKEEGDIPGYHCWAEAYAKGKGWIPIDATEAKKTGKVENYFGLLPPNRIEFSRGRDIVLNPPQKGEPLNYFVYPYAESDETPYTLIDSKFSFKKIKSS